MNQPSPQHVQTVFLGSLAVLFLLVQALAGTNTIYAPSGISDTAPAPSTRYDFTTP